MLNVSLLKHCFIDDDDWAICTGREMCGSKAKKASSCHLILSQDKGGVILSDNEDKTGIWT